ncbi:MAG: alginate lyase family protein [Pseudomonadota bacterium]
MSTVMGWFQKTVCRPLFGLALTGLLPSALAAIELDEIHVTRPGNLLFDHAQRRETLASMAPDERAHLCGSDRHGWPEHGVVRNVYNGKQPGENVAYTLMTGAAAAFGNDDDAARTAVIDNLRRWARGGALERFKRNPTATMYYNLDRTLLPVIVAFSLVQPDMSSEDQELIEQWLDQLVWRRGPDRERDPKRRTSRNNHRLLSDSVTMAWGALQGRDELFRAGIERYLVAIRQMRPDGSLPLETARGARALSYQRHAIASLVTIAEMAAAQGYDLYAVEGNGGQSIHRAIAFLLDGIDDPELVWPYAMENTQPGPNQNYRVQDLGFMIERGHGRHYMSWTEAYIARFPDSDIAKRLQRTLAEFGSREHPMIDDYSGGSASCFFTQPGQADWQS